MIPAGSITVTGGSSTNSGWVITEEDGTIAGLPPMPSVVDFDGAGNGTCQVWYINYEDGITGLMAGNNIADVMGCFELSNPIDVVRNQPEAGMLTGGPFDFCVDGTPDFVSGITLTGESGPNTGYIITDDQGTILGLPPTPEVVNFDGAGAGVCLIYHISYTDDLTGLAADQNIADLDGCFTISNSITVTRVQPIGGMVSLADGATEIVGCAGDIILDVQTTSTSTAGNYIYVITDNNGTILATHDAADGNTIDVSAAPPGTCRIYGWSFAEEDPAIPGEPISSLTANGCSALSDNFITIYRDVADGGTVSLTSGGEEYVGCAGDIVVDVAFSSTADRLNYWFIITDDDDRVITFQNAVDGSTLDLSAAPAGECHIWGWSELGQDLPQPGQTIGSLTNDICEDISDNFITVFRETAEGGQISLADGTQMLMATVGDIVFSLHHHNHAENLPYFYVITDANDFILAYHDTANGKTLDLSGAPEGECRVWGWSYLNEPLPTIGNNISTLYDGVCEDISDDFVTIIRKPACDAIGGTLEGGPFNFCVDGEADFVSGITLEGNVGDNNAWIITDEQGNILGLPPMPGVVNFDEAGAGVCLIWNIAYQDGLIGLEGGASVADLDGCFDISNAVTVYRDQPIGGTLEGGPFNFCVDGEADFVSGITLTGNAGESNAWIVTDLLGNILGLPPMPGVVNFDEAGAGVCLIWNIAYQEGLTGLEAGSNVAELNGCFDISNAVTVYRTADGVGCDMNCTVEGGTLEGGPFEFCVDGEADNVSGITLTGESGPNTQWVVTDANGLILGLPPMPSVVDFDGAGAGVCFIWHISYEDGLTGLEAESNLFSGIMGCYSISNAVTVVRSQPIGGTLEGGPFNFCVDGEADFVSGITLTGNEGDNNAWIITDDQGNILGLPPMPGVVNFDEAGAGVCLIWNIAYQDGLTGLEAGANVADLDGCFDISNSITVNREQPIGGTLEGGPFNFCVDGEADFVSGITLTGNNGSNNAWIITDDQGNILGLPPMPGVVNFDEAGAGVCLIWNIAYQDGLTGLEAGANVADLDGCFDISNSITVNREQPIGGTLEGGPFNFCVDGEADFVSGITLTGNEGDNNAWIITDDQGNILGLPPMPGVVNFDEAGAGVCLIWNIAYQDGLSGLEAGANVADLDGCFDISNSITVNREQPIGGTLEGGPFNFCADGEADFVSGITLTGNTGSNNAWIITDDQGNILGLPPMPGVVNFDEAGAGVCLIWNIAYQDGLSGLEAGANVADLDGCFDISNSITVNREQPIGGTLEGGPFNFCVDGEADFVSGITLTGNEGDNNAWIITDDQGNILGLPPMPGIVNFDEAGAGVCLIWNIAYQDGLTGLEAGANVADLDGCFDISNSITVNRQEADGGTVTTIDGETTVIATVGDVVVEVQHTTTATALSYWYIITDADDNILEWQNSADGNVLDLSAAPAGECHIWGWSYQGLPDPVAGENISTLADDGCEDISDNSITVLREVPEGGTVALPDGSTTVNALAGNVIIEVSHTTSATNLNYWYIITDADDNILEWQNAADGNVLDLSAAPAGQCHIWGWSELGSDLPVAGEHITSLDDDSTEDISDNWITVVRSATATEEEVFASLSIYPNPAVDYITIDMQAQDVDAEGQVILLDARGQQVRSQAIQQGQQSIVFEVSELPTGTYLLNMTLGRESFSKRILIVK